MDEKKIEVLGRLIPSSGKIHQNQEVYNALRGGVMCTIKAVHYKDPPKVLISRKVEDKDEQDYSNWELEKGQ